MKFLFLLATVFSFNAHAYLYSDFSRTYISEIECLENKPSEINCEKIQNGLMMCRTEFDALMKNAGIKTLNVTIYEEISVDSKIFRPFTDKINEFSAKSEATRQVKEKVKLINKVKQC
ncbi:MAG TPA: hypothetical protein VKZ84_01715 [Bacteriovoracaceae bacterium]|nr:hypothetical protein [Bacteriovoracaceae bacterium]